MCVRTEWNIKSWNYWIYDPFCISCEYRILLDSRVVAKVPVMLKFRSTQINHREKPPISKWDTEEICFDFENANTGDCWSYKVISSFKTEYSISHGIATLIWDG